MNIPMVAQGEDVKAACTSYFNELLQNRETNDKDEIRLLWREAVQMTCEEFQDIDEQKVYQLTEEVLWEHLERNDAKVEFNWMKEGF